MLEQELLEPLTKRDQRDVRCCHRYSSDRDDIQNEHGKDEGGSLTGDYPCVSRCTSARVISSMASHKSSGTFPEADPGRGRQVVRAEPMSTLDAELNDFGAQLAMLRGHAADRDG